MTRSARVLGVAVLAWALLLGVGARPSFACSCAGGSTMGEDLARTPVVLVATTTRIDLEVPPPTDPADSFAPSDKLVTMEVVRVHKGAVGRRIVVQTGSDGGMCGYGFEVGRTEVVFGQWRGERLAVGSCSRTMPLTQMLAADLAVLGEGRPPAGEVDDPVVEEAAEPDESMLAAFAGTLTPAVGWTVLALVVGGGAASGLVLRRRRRVDA